MTLGIRGKLLLISLLVLGVVGGISGSMFYDRLLHWLQQRTDDELWSKAGVVAVAVERAPTASVDALQTLTRDMAQAMGPELGLQVMVVTTGGDVLADTRVDASQLGRENPSEVAAEMARARDCTACRVRSHFSFRGRDLRYVARAFVHGNVAGVVRLGMSSAATEQLLAELNLILVFTAVIGVAIAVVMSGLSSLFMARAIRELVQQTLALSEGQSEQAPALEINRLAGTVSRVSEELKRSVGELRRERDWFETVVDSMSEAIVALDRNLRVTLANRAALTLLRLADSPKGKPVLEVVRDPAVQALIGSAADQPASAEVTLEGTQRQVLVRATPLEATGGLVLVMLDVTEMRRLERVRRDFVANVSHELRTPVSVVQANAETLLSGGLDDELRAREFVRAIMRNAERLGRLVTDLLDLSRIEAGELRLKPKAVVVGDKVNKVIATLEPLARGAEHRVRIGDLSQRVWADAAALEQVLVNLLHNALKYTPDGTEVEVSAQQLPGAVRVMVRDSGPGIPAKHHRRIFERFYRVDRGRSRDMGGTGLGLAIVKHLVEAMGGQVGLEAAEPQGSIFWFTLPAAPDA